MHKIAEPICQKQQQLDLSQLNFQCLQGRAQAIAIAIWLAVRLAALLKMHGTGTGAALGLIVSPGFVLSVWCSLLGLSWGCLSGMVVLAIACTCPLLWLYQFCMHENIFAGCMGT